MSQLPENAARLIERLREDAHNEPGTLGLYARHLLEDYDRGEVDYPTSRTALLRSTWTGRVERGPSATLEIIERLVGAGLGVYVFAPGRSVGDGAEPIGFQINQLGRFVARLIREL